MTYCNAVLNRLYNFFPTDHFILTHIPGFEEMSDWMKIQYSFLAAQIYSNYTFGEYEIQQILDEASKHAPFDVANARITKDSLVSQILVFLELKAFGWERAEIEFGDPISQVMNEKRVILFMRDPRVKPRSYNQLSKDEQIEIIRLTVKSWWLPRRKILDILKKVNRVLGHHDLWLINNPENKDGIKYGLIIV